MKSEELLAKYEARRQEVEAYARTWWSRRTEPQRSFLARNPAVRTQLIAMTLRGAEVATTDVYSENGGQSWVEQRVQLHAELLSDLDAVDPPDHVTEEAQTRDERAEGAVYFLLGLPGSGKTTALRPIALGHAQSSETLATSDADEVRVRFPEYSSGLGSGVVQVETALVTYGTGYLAGEGRQSRVLSRRASVIVDVIGDPEYLPPTVQRIAAQGRKVFLLCSQCSAEECKSRVMKRAISSGRFVPTWLVDAKQGVPERAFEAALATGDISGWALVDTSGRRARIARSDGTFDAYLDTEG